MSAIKVLSVAAITVMSLAVAAQARHVNAPTARVNPPKINVPKGNAGTYKKPGSALGYGSINKVFTKPNYPSGPTPSVGRTPMPFAPSAHAGQVRQPNLQVNVRRTGLPNPPPPTGVRAASSGHTRLLGPSVAPASHSRPHLKPLVRVPSAPVAR